MRQTTIVVDGVRRSKITEITREIYESVHLIAPQPLPAND